MNYDVVFRLHLREINFRVDIFSRVKIFLISRGHIFEDDSNSKFSRMLVNIDKIIFQGNKKNDSFIETHAWNKAWRSNILIEITTNEIINKKRFLLFVFKISYSKKKLSTLLSLETIDLLKEEILSFQFVTWLHVTTWSEGHVTSWVSFHHRLVKFGGHRLCGIGDIKLLIYHVTSRDHAVRGSCGIIVEFPSS